ncbi:hypothetical protein P3X46_015871 [Hevea brasiliensis]|uniref:MLO-like protein n=1 Tax=Hevea brasiliensis TaxID=3981 RepID=A0ABQ9LXC8_HEVBR|nr:MLO-like protein 4 [Hevea brasiliensis]KAJ9172657.1 hypothetical protein P3X46_015871 [Hevea brasiliensis]
MDEVEIDEDKSLALTPTWALATVITVMVCFGFFCQASLNQFGKWLDKTKRKALLSALEKIKDELMLFGFLSLLMGHWVVLVAKICVKTSALSSRFFPCAIYKLEGRVDSASSYSNNSSDRQEHDHCPEGHESFASQESLEQLHHLMFVLGIIHVLYSFIAVALAMIKIYSWRIWEKQARDMATRSAPDYSQAALFNRSFSRLSTFISHHTSHPWSRHRVLVWLLCFSRQFWSSINYADYMALRYGFITTHELPLAYDFHSYMLRSMEEEFRDIVGISLPLWIYAICCIFLDFHETEVYFWLSFLPAILILLIGTKLHRVVIKLAVEILDAATGLGNQQLNLRDKLFWFGKPKLLLWLIQLISFQNAFEMATFIWSLWEIRDSSCFMSNELFVIVRLIFGVVTQFWCSFITFPLYIIITQMDAKFKKTVISENVRESLHGWKRRVRARHSSSSARLNGIPFRSSHSSTSAHLKGLSFKSSSSTTHKRKNSDSASSSSKHKSTPGIADRPTSCQEADAQQANSSTNNLPGREFKNL